MSARISFSWQSIGLGKQNKVRLANHRGPVNSFSAFGRRGSCSPCFNFRISTRSIITKRHETKLVVIQTGFPKKYRQVYKHAVIGNLL